MQRITGLALGTIGDELIVFFHKAVIGVHGHLLIDRSLGDGGLHHRLVVPGTVFILNVILIDEHRRPVDHHAVVGLGGEALAPLLI